MKKFVKLTIETTLLMSLALTLTTTPAMAENSPGCSGGPPSFAEFDTDGDGFLSQAEFDTGRANRHAAMAKKGQPMKGMSTAPSFSDVDVDADGRISPDEFSMAHSKHKKQMRGERQGQGQGQGQGKGQYGKNRGGMSYTTFEAIDSDADGCISRAEFEAHHAKESQRP